jgi:hypothetical protein
MRAAMQEDITFHPDEFSAVGDATSAFADAADADESLTEDWAADDTASFADDDPAMEAEGDQVIELDPRVAEMRDALQTLRDTEVSHALRELRQLFPHIPFPKRVRALMAVRHGAMAG